MIAVTMTGLNVYEVVVDNDTETTHQVTLRPEYYQQLCQSRVTHEWLLIQSFRFLLEREPNTAILERFDLEQVQGYFPEFESELRQRIGA